MSNVIEDISTGITRLGEGRGHIRFFLNDGREIAVITPEGKFQRGKDFDSNDEASAAFMSCIEKLFETETTRLRNCIGELEQEIAGFQLGRCDDN